MLTNTDIDTIRTMIHTEIKPLEMRLYALEERFDILERKIDAMIELFSPLFSTKSDVKEINFRLNRAEADISALKLR